MPPAGPSYLPPHTFQLYAPPPVAYHQTMAPASFTWQLPPHLTAQMAAASSSYHQQPTHHVHAHAQLPPSAVIPADPSSSSSKRRRLDEEEDQLMMADRGGVDDDDDDELDAGDSAWMPEEAADDDAPRRVARRRSSKLVERNAADDHGDGAANVDDAYAGEPTEPRERTFRNPAGDSHSDVELMPDVVIDGVRPPEDTVENLFEIPLLVCEWDRCANGYWTVDDLVDHLTNGPSRARGGLD